MLTITPIPAFDDNYIWLLNESGSDRAVVVDPGDDAPVEMYLRQHGMALSAILITHKHGDHVGGVHGLKQRHPEVLVIGPADEPIAGLERRLHGGEEIEVPGLQSRFSVMAVPGHTEGHLAYYGAGALFCGDTLFAAGCGRVFSGTHQQLSDSLGRIAALPPETRLYCAHEYTLDNLGFALWVEPDSEALKQRLERDRAARERGEPTVPSTLELELQTNPFLRSGVEGVAAAAGRYAGRELTTNAEIFTAIRTWKDREYD